MGVVRVRVWVRVRVVVVVRVTVRVRLVVVVRVRMGIGGENTDGWCMRWGSGLESPNMLAIRAVRHDSYTPSLQPLRLLP